MIIDSHAHYNNNAYKKPFRYLTRNESGYALAEGDREQLFRELLDANIPYSIEPGVSIQSSEEVLELCAAYPGRIFPAIGIHPTRSIYENWSDRKKLDALARMPGVIAVGEIGLDYHHKREEQFRLKQHLWFLYQLNLAWKLKLPVILHVRDAHADALRILRWHPARKLGGVIHCFYGSREIAEQYLKLGYHIGIGGAILQLEERAKDLWEAVSYIPLDRILIETDAPFILPYCKAVIQPKLLRRTRNTSLILPAVIEKIAELKGITVEDVERATAENAIRLFRLLSLNVKLKKKHKAQNRKLRFCAFLLGYSALALRLDLTASTQIVTITPTARAAAKMLALGTKEVVPSELVICSAPESTAAPMAGPMTPGISTWEKIRRPWNWPDLPSGVKSRT